MEARERRGETEWIRRFGDAAIVFAQSEGKRERGGEREREREGGREVPPRNLTSDILRACSVRQSLMLTNSEGRPTPVTQAEWWSVYR